jgi:holliday junction DNA helicase RuvA
VIGKLFGIVEHIYESSLILNVNNVGYQIFCQAGLLKKLPSGQNLTLFVETQIREQQQEIQLFGFETEKEKEMFTMLRSVSGVGSKMALSLLSLGIENIVAAVQKEEAPLIKAPGVGKKLAERIILELKAKLANWQTGSADLFCKTTEAAMALSKLGLTYTDALERAQKAAATSQDASTEDLVRLALQNR